MATIYSLIVVIAFSLGISTPAHAGGEGGEGESTAAVQGVTKGTTNRVVRLLNRGFQGCQRLEWVYRYDCYRSTYSSAINQIARNRAYDDIREVLTEVEQSLTRTVTRNTDPGVRNKRRGVNVYRPIKPSALPRAKQEFTAALQRAETKLLRSASKGDRYVRVAQALNTNKVLIRSAMNLLAPRWATAGVSAIAACFQVPPLEQLSPNGLKHIQPV